MPRLQNFFECIARSLCEIAKLSASGELRIGNSLSVVASYAHQQIIAQCTDADLRAALREVVAAPQETVELSMEDAVGTLVADHPSVKRNNLLAFLELLQPIVRELLRRPGDAAGTSVPEQLAIGDANDWLVFLPDRLARFRPGDAPRDYGDWHLTDLRGLGPFSEVWHGLADDSAKGAALLKFITDERAAATLLADEEYFNRLVNLAPSSGLVPLRSVSLKANPPCLEYAFVSGYNAAGLIRDWRWRDERLKPDQASLIIKRAARIVGLLHQGGAPLVHRGLKPSNILLHPTDEGKVNIWISDMGWGAISTCLALEHAESFQAEQQARRGALATLYASPEQRNGAPPDPRDDIYALGVIWHQLLLRDMTAPAPQGSDWVAELRQLGVDKGLVRLIASCIDANPNNRPANGLVLASQIDANFSKPSAGAFRNA